MKDLREHMENMQSFSLIFETTNKFVIVFVRLILGKMGVDRFTGPRPKTDVRYEFDFTVVLKDLLCK